jgi:hypothetical protein
MFRCYNFFLILIIWAIEKTMEQYGLTFGSVTWNLAEGINRIRADSFLVTPQVSFTGMRQSADLMSTAGQSDSIQDVYVIYLFYSSSFLTSSIDIQ